MPLATAFEKQARSARHAEALLRAAEREAEAGPHLVEDQQRAARRAELLAGSARKPSRGASNVVGSRITQAVSSSSASSTDCEIVVREGVGQRRDVASGMPRLRSVTRDVPVVPAVVAAAQHLVAAGEGARQPHRRAWSRRSRSCRSARAPRPGPRSRTSSATSTSSGCISEKVIPSRELRADRVVDRGVGVAERAAGRRAMVKSRYSLPSTSHDVRALAARAGTWAPRRARAGPAPLASVCVPAGMRSAARA